MGRKTVVVVASSGLVLGGATPAFADAPTAVDAAARASQATTVAGAESLASVTAEASWELDVPTLTVNKPAPPKPKPAATAKRAKSAPSAAKKGSTKAVPPWVNGNAVLEIAARYVGTPYVYGGSSPSGFDCSGFTQYVYAQLGISIPRTSEGQKAAGTVIPRSEAKPGDLVWFPGHIGIYAGGNQMIDSPRTGKTIQVREIYRSDPVFVRF
jgi:cell wall-associated NlpC family hydrolase